MSSKKREIQLKYDLENVVNLIKFSQNKTNLKKQGLLALTFSDPDDYNLIGPKDRISILGLAHMAPGKPIKCLIQHEDGTVNDLTLSHSYGASQIEWFRAGSALNLLH